LIGPGGLLVVVSHLFVVPFLVLWLGLGKRKREYSLEIFEEDHTVRWRCSKLSGGEIR
jgi:hypothetical protein